jgi:hypothetical protein
MSGDGWMPGVLQVRSPNFWVGNHDRRAACLHVVQGSFQSALSEFRSSRTQKSAHFTISKTGVIAQHVSIHDSAWANGLEWVMGRWRSPEGHWVIPTWADIVPGVNPNRDTVSIEHEGDPGDPWTAAMFDANTRVLRYIASETGLVYVPHRTLIGHYEISPIDRSFCPGPHVDYAAIAAAANAPAELRFMVVVDVANIRQGPGTTFPIAGQIRRGEFLIADKVIAGQVVNNDSQWAHIGPADPTRANLGFVHRSLLARVP